MRLLIPILTLFVSGLGLVGQATLRAESIEQEFISESIELSAPRQHMLEFRLKSPQGTLFREFHQEAHILYQGKTYPVSVEECLWDELSKSTIIRLSLPENWDVSDAYSIQLDLLHSDRKLLRMNQQLAMGKNSIELGQNSISYEYSFNEEEEGTEFSITFDAGIYPVSIYFTESDDTNLHTPEHCNYIETVHSWSSPEKKLETKAFFYDETQIARSMHLRYLEGPFSERCVTLQVPARETKKESHRSGDSCSEPALELVAHTFNLLDGGIHSFIMNGMEGRNRTYRFSAPAQGAAVLRSITLTHPEFKEIRFDQRLDLHSHALYIELSADYNETAHIPTSDSRLLFEGVYAEQPLVTVAIPCLDHEGTVTTESGIISYTDKPSTAPKLLPAPYLFEYTIMSESMQYGFRLLDEERNYLQTESLSRGVGVSSMASGQFHTNSFAIGTSSPVKELEFLTLPLPLKQWSVEIPFKRAD